MIADSARPFAWGAATSAYQIEGGRFEGGKGTSIWDTFADAGRLAVPGDVACDHFHRWEDDLDLLQELGVSSYRFSIAWTRILPDGVGEVNPEGIAFYRKLVEGMRDRGIDPWLTLYHWDLPQALQDGGGWLNRQTVDAFEVYAGKVADALGDLVTHWITQNEPWVSAFLGHRDGIFAPGLTDWNAALTAGHHLLLSHGRAVDAIRERVAGAEVGIAIDCRPASPASEEDDDILATRHFDGFRNRWFFDPVFGRGYPEDLADAYSAVGRISDPPEFIRPGDMETIARPVDFLGVNYYTTTVVGTGLEESDEPFRPPGVDQPDGVTEMGWLVDPDGLRDYLIHLSAEYSPASIVVTENGASYSVAPDAGGSVHDTRRIEYLASHIDAVLQAAAAGAPVDGYFVWSFLDNIEWVLGPSQRFGMVWVDFVSLDRIPKDSFYWYQARISDLAAG